MLRDKEPEVETVDLSWAGDCCKFCGHDDHETVDCPFRPAPKKDD